MKYRIESKNELGKWEDGIGDQEIYEYDTEAELLNDVEYMDLGIENFKTNGIYRMVEIY